MLTIVDRGAYWDCEANIIFNPVSLSKNKIGESIFHPVIRENYPKAFYYYKDYMKGMSKRELLGDIQLVQIEHKKFIMNAYVYDQDILNEKALTKALIEFSNLLEEYHITGSVRSTFGSKNKKEYDNLEKILNTTLGDNNQNIFVFKPSKKK